MIGAAALLSARGTFRSLAIRNYRIFFSTQLISLTGTWMQSVGQMWLVLHLTSSALALGITAALQFTPMLLVGTWGGLVADRGDKRRVLIATQSVAGVLALTLGALTLSGQVRLWMVWTLALCLGVVNVVDNPTRQSFVGEMVGANRIANAVGLNSAMFTSARVIGPAIAGFLISAFGTGWCFALNGLSYAAVIAGLLLMRQSELFPSRPVARARGQIAAGIGYAWARRELRLPLLLMLVLGTVSFNFTTLLPLMARFVFHSGAQTFGALLSVMAVGALAGALVSAARQRPTHRLLGVSAAAFGTLLLAAALAPSLAVELALLVGLGAAMVTYQTASNSLVQLNSEPAYRGRTLALYMVVFLGGTPLGAPAMGWVAQTFGPRAALGIGGVVAIAGGLAALAAVSRWRPASEPSAARFPSRFV